MAKTLNQFLEGTGILKVKSPDEQRFVDKHVTATIADRNGNGDDVFKGSKVKKVDRRKERHGYETGEDAKVYEEAEQIDELKKKTMSNYIRRASSDAANYAYTAGMKDFGKGINKDEYHDKATKRLKGISMAAQKLAKEDVELEENAWNQLGQTKPVGGTLPAPKKGSVPKHGQKFSSGDLVVAHSGPHAGEVHKVTASRAGGVTMVNPNGHKYDSVTVKAKHEHVSPANDAQKAKYHADSKAFADRVKALGEEAELEEKAGYSATAAKAGKDLGKPGKNFAKIARGAAAKYGSEAAGERVAGAVLKKLRKEDRLIDLLDTVTESQAFTMVTVFNSLSEENQNMFLASCETEEGVEKMLDFSIQNRGAE